MRTDRRHPNTICLDLGDWSDGEGRVPPNWLPLFLSALRKPRPAKKTTLHGLILNNPYAASKDLFKAGLQNREHFRPLETPRPKAPYSAAPPLSRLSGHGSEINAPAINTVQHRLALFAFACGSPALAQDKGTLHPEPLPPLANPADPRLPAKQVFGRALTPVEGQARSIGFYSRGCLAGAKALPVDGESWQVVRLSRNRMWGNPAMIAFLERFSRKAKAEGVWNGILVGDISQPRGGPMLTGHASHQVGLDADVWLTPMPDHTALQTRNARPCRRSTWWPRTGSRSQAHWTPAQAAIIKAAAEEPEVQRIFVNAAIKKALCETAKGQPWMNKVRAYWGHNYHFHIRIKCPAGESGCEPQEPVPPGDGCDKSLAWWFTDEALHPRPGRRSRRCRWRRCRPNAERSFWKNSGQTPSSRCPSDAYGG